MSEDQKMAAPAAGAEGAGPATEQASVEHLVRDIVRHNISLDYDACGEYSVNSPSCKKIKENWRKTLASNPELIYTIADIYAAFHGGDNELREVLRAQVVLMLATWLQRVAKLDAELEEMIGYAYGVLHQHGVLLDVPDELEELEWYIFADWMSIHHTIQFVIDKL